MNQSNLKKLQNLLKEKDSDIFVINRSDEYLNEYISPNAERLNFITNFSGSAGRAIITPTDAFLYVDGRYTLQANNQSGRMFKIITIPDKMPNDILKGKKLLIGFDPNLFTERSLFIFFGKNKFKLNFE